MITLYGIPNCDSVKKARKWLETRGIDYRFHDFRREGLDQKTVATWLKKLGADTLINRRGTTFRQLDDSEKSALDGKTAAEVLERHPTLIKRPVFESADTLACGFSAETYERLTADTHH